MTVPSWDLMHQLQKAVEHLIAWQAAGAQVLCDNWPNLSTAYNNQRSSKSASLKHGESKSQMGKMATSSGQWPTCITSGPVQ